MLFIKHPSEVTSHDTAKNLMRKHVMSPNKFTMTRTTKENFNISDVSQHVKRQLPINDSAGVTKTIFYPFDNSCNRRFDSSRAVVCGE